MTSRNVAHRNRFGLMVGWAGLPPTRSTTLLIAAALLFAPAASGAAPAGNGEHAAQVQLSAAASQETQPLPPAPGATTTGRPASPASPAPSQRPPQVVMPASNVPATGSLLQTVLALALVLGLLLGLAWIMKRYGPRAMGTSANVKLVGALNIGGRERIMVIEVGEQWIVVGASPGQVNALATMPRQESSDMHANLSAPVSGSFGDWLKNTIDKRNAK